MHRPTTSPDSPIVAGRTDVSWPVVLVIGALAIVALIGVFWSTVQSAVYQWNTSSAYNYGYLIAPITAYMIWGERRALAAWRPSPSWLGGLLTLIFAAMWLVGDVLGIDEGRHIAFVGMLQGLFLGILGWRLYRRIAFPLVYLWLMVPTGEFLLGPLQNLSHAAAVWMLKVSGIPVFGEGILIQVPSGNFLVEPGCSGLNFLLASIALALLYGKMTYQRWSTRFITLGVAVAVSILANFIRVYLIVAITEWSDRKINISDDHLFYGWVFFGIVMLVMMWFGMRFKDTPDAPARPETECPAGPVASSPLPILISAVACVAVATVAPSVSALTETAPDNVDVAINLPRSVGEWTSVDAPSDWSPTTVPGDSAAQSHYINDDIVIDVSVTFYAAQSDNREAAAGSNQTSQLDRWQQNIQTTRRIELNGRDLSVQSVVLTGASGTRRALSWYVSSGCITSSRLQAKICAARDRLLGTPSPGAYVAVSTRLANEQRRDHALHDFLRQFDIAAALPNSRSSD